MNKRLFHIAILGSDQSIEIELDEKYPEPPKGTQLVTSMNCNYKDILSSSLAVDRRTEDLYFLRHDKSQRYKWQIS